MGTPYQDCYDAFLSQIEDVDILYPQSDETNEEYLIRLDFIVSDYFNKSVPKYANCRTSLERNNTTKTFLYNLRDIEIQIIGMLMLKEYYRKKFNFLASLKGSFSDKDFKSHDKANQMNQYRQSIKEIDAEIRELKINNSYTGDNGVLESWDA